VFCSLAGIKEEHRSSINTTYVQDGAPIFALEPMACCSHSSCQGFVRKTIASYFLLQGRCMFRLLALRLWSVSGEKILTYLSLPSEGAEPGLLATASCGGCRAESMPSEVSLHYV